MKTFITLPIAIIIYHFNINRYFGMGLVFIPNTDNGGPKVELDDVELYDEGGYGPSFDSF